jgi:ABC-type enterochelin transport system substrate-binding protein
MKVFNILAGIALCVALPLQAAESTTKTQESSATAASASAQASQTAVIYDRHGQPITAMQEKPAQRKRRFVKRVWRLTLPRRQ